MSSGEHTTYVISVAAELAGMHPQTLRQYDRLGIVIPARTKGRGRRYTPGDVERLRLVQRLSQDEGINLEGIRRILQLRRELDAARSEVEQLRREVERMRAQVEQFETRRDRVFAASPSGDVFTTRRGIRVSARESIGARGELIRLPIGSALVVFDRDAQR